MEKVVYIKLINEGVDVYRPVPATEVRKDIYRIEGSDIYDPEDEIWEFSPGSCVVAVKRLLGNEELLVAMHLVQE